MAAIRVFAPATVANLGPGFDLLGLAVTGPGDEVEATPLPQPGRVTLEVVGGAGIPTDPEANTAGIAARALLRQLGDPGGVALRLVKGLPPGSGLGSSAASAVAAAWAVARLYAPDLPREALLGACLEAEATVSGRHLDNVAPALLGGLVLVRRVDPPQVLPLPFPRDLHLALVAPRITFRTEAARALLPRQVALEAAVAQGRNLAALLTACFRDDPDLFTASLEDWLAEPYRIPRIPGFARARAAALEAGAQGGVLAGSGPTLALVGRRPGALVTAAGAAVAVWAELGIEAKVYLVQVDRRGVREVEGGG